MLAEKRLDLPLCVGGGRRLIGHGGAEAARLELVFHVREHGQRLALDVEVVIRAGIDDDRRVRPPRRHRGDHALTRRRRSPVVGPADQDAQRSDHLLLDERAAASRIEADGRGESDGGH